MNGIKHLCHLDQCSFKRFIYVFKPIENCRDKHTVYSKVGYPMDMDISVHSRDKMQIANFVYSMKFRSRSRFMQPSTGPASI